MKLAPHTLIPRKSLAAAAAQLNPRGIRGLPNMVALMLGMPSAPPELVAIANAVADENAPPIKITIASGAASFVLEVK